MSDGQASADRDPVLADPHRIAQEAAEAGAAVADGLTVTLDVAEALGELADRHHRLHAREGQAGAGVNAGAEGEVAIRMTAQV